MEKKKIYILDTNVLVYDPKAIFSFKGALVGIPVIVLEELDSFKQEHSDRGRNAREVNRILDELRQQGSLAGGVELEKGGVLQVLFFKSIPESAFPDYFKQTADNIILQTAVSFKNEGYEVRFISKDLNARVKADVLGIKTEDYLKDKVSEDQFYHGWTKVESSAVQLKREFPDVLQDLLATGKLIRNEFVLIEGASNPYNNKVFRFLGGQKFVHVAHPKLAWQLEARNPQQLMALNLLLDPTIEFLVLSGPAGTGKTFLALLAGLHQVLIQDIYKKMLISRPVVPLGKDIGYLPGTIEEKLHSWMLPIYDNMEFILYNANKNSNYRNDDDYFKKNKNHSKDKERNKSRDKYHDKKRHGKLKRSRGGLGPIDAMIRSGKLSLEAITYMRGRSIPYQFILIDEVQNLTPHEVKTLVTRVGEGSKIILAGDPYQIDSPYLDFSSNGLVVVSERFKGHKLFGSVYLENSERSQLSKLSAELL